jgi:endonuclease-3 related protein
MPLELYSRLHARFGDLEWWPAEGPFEVMVGAVLTQRTAWSNVEKAMFNLGEAGVKDTEGLLRLPLQTLEDLIRPSGTYRQKARRLTDLFTAVASHEGGALEVFLDRPTAPLRAHLLSIKGIGPETADSIVLYAGGKPVFVVDAYTRRVLERLGVMTGGSYDDVARWFTDGLPEDVTLYNNFHAALVELAKEHCRKAPLCTGCPLQEVCPSASSHPIRRKE